MKSTIHECQKNNFKVASKKLILMTFLMVGMTIVAQPRNNRQPRNEMEQFTPEQRSQLQLKQMTLNLDLSDAQQKEMKVIIADMNAKKEAHRTTMKAMKDKDVKPTTDERFAMKMKMLDEQIAIKKRMEKILNPKQYEKWTALKEEHKKDFKDDLKRKQQRYQYQQRYHRENQQRRG